MRHHHPAITGPARGGVEFDIPGRDLALPPSAESRTDPGTRPTAIHFQEHPESQADNAGQGVAFQVPSNTRI